MDNFSNSKAILGWLNPDDSIKKVVVFKDIKLNIDNTEELTILKKILRKNEIEFQVLSISKN